VTAKPARVPQQLGHVLELSCSVSTWFWLKNVSWVQGECVKTKKHVESRNLQKQRSRASKRLKRNIYIMSQPDQPIVLRVVSFTDWAQSFWMFLGCGALLQLSSVGSARTMVTWKIIPLI
jgi:hypothetical protein